MINRNRLRELTAELGFIPATTDGPDIDRHRHSTRTRTTGWPMDQTLWLLGQEFVEVTAQVFPTTEDPEAENDVDSAPALVMLSGGTSTVVSLGRFYEGGDIVSVALFGSKGHTRFDVVSPETGEDPQLLALELQAEAFAQHARGAAS